MIRTESREILIITRSVTRCTRLVECSQTDLATRAGLSLPTVKRVEIDLGIRVSDDARSKLRHALETAGIEFIDENGGGPGVRLRKGAQKKR